MKLFVKNISFKAKESELKELFEDFGDVDSCKLIKDRETGRSRGFAFIEMPNADAEHAMAELHDSDWKGRTLVVKEATDKKR